MVDLNIATRVVAVSNDAVQELYPLKIGVLANILSIRVPYNVSYRLGHRYVYRGKLEKA